MEMFLKGHSLEHYWSLDLLILHYNNILITTYWYGHGVGMSQYGANEMAKLGSTYEEIIYHYYNGVLIEKK